jgi:hypothetical protein
VADQTTTTRHLPVLPINTHAIASRLAIVADLALCPECEHNLTQVMADIADLMVEVARLSGALIAARRESANRLAAIRATLRAAAEGEADPLRLLRDELAESPGTPIPGQDWGWCR